MVGTGALSLRTGMWYSGDCGGYYGFVCGCMSCMWMVGEGYDTHGVSGSVVGGRQGGGLNRRFVAVLSTGKPTQPVTTIHY